MTNKEAIEILKQFKKCLADVVFDEKGSEAWQMAIKALENHETFMKYSYEQGKKDALSQEPYICDSCKHKDAEWDTEPCDGCCGNHSGYEPCDDAISQNQSNACSILDDECPYPYKHCWGCSLNYQYELAKLELENKDRLPQRKSNADEKHIENTLERQTGKWIEQEGWDGDVYYECSVCGEPFCLIEGTPTDNMYNYCPNCGAKMESEEQTE